MNLVNATKKTLALALVGTLALVTGCASTTSESAAAATPATASAHAEKRVEHRELANGIELTISDDASPEARLIAEQIQSEMRSRYISAR